MVLNKGEIVHVLLRRLFAGEQRRHFVGRVKEVEGTLARLKGFAFHYDEVSNQFNRRPGVRERIVGLGHPGVLVSVLPDDVELEQLRYDTSEDGVRVLTDGAGFQLDMSEFGTRL